MSCHEPISGFLDTQDTLCRAAILLPLLHSLVSHTAGFRQFLQANVLDGPLHC